MNSLERKEIEGSTEREKDGIQREKCRETEKKRAEMEREKHRDYTERKRGSRERH